MQKRKDRIRLTSRRAFALAAVTLFAGVPELVRAKPDGATPPASPPAKPVQAPTGAAKPLPKPTTRPQAGTPARTARLPRRLAADFRRHTESRLPHLRPLFEAAARETGFTWRQLAALGYQESKWLPAAVSPQGAQGLMMLMPQTAKKMGVTNVFAADQNIMAGAKYLALMRTRIPKRIKDPDRTWLAMAAYNIGIGHLEDARIITQMRKKNPDRWADVRTNLPRLSDPKWHSRVKRGYARGEETAEFVERVSQFNSLLEHYVPDVTEVRNSR
jgi:membrane-bound lytic murein transglycosylase MltF